jgi:hypothetical protein
MADSKMRNDEKPSVRTALNNRRARFACWRVWDSDIRMMSYTTKLELRIKSLTTNKSRTLRGRQLLPKGCQFSSTDHLNEFVLAFASLGLSREHARYSPSRLRKEPTAERRCEGRTARWKMEKDVIGRANNKVMNEMTREKAPEYRSPTSASSCIMQNVALTSSRRRMPG